MTQELNHQNELNPTAQPSHIETQKSKKKSKQTGLLWFDDPYCVVKGETGLWIAVITQALVDALSKSKNPELQYHKDQAIRWLTDNNKDFIQVCLLAGLDPDYVRKKAKKAIVSPTAWRAAPGFGKRYLERKTYRQRIKGAVAMQIKSPIAPEEECRIITGPWQTPPSFTS